MCQTVMLLGNTGAEPELRYSPAFKRAAVKIGIARYLYSLDKPWVAYDAQRKQLKEIPKLPAWALPKNGG